SNLLPAAHAAAWMRHPCRMHDGGARGTRVQSCAEQQHRTPSRGQPMRIRKGDVEIRSLEAWRQHAPPAAEGQWVSGRSARCMAEAWLAEAPPVPVRRLLASHPDIGPLRLEEVNAEPECKIRFDTYGGPRQADLAFIASDDAGRIAV